MAAERELAIKITGDTRGLGRAFGQVDAQASKMERSLGGLRRGFAGLAKGAAVAGAAVAAAGVAFAKVGIDEALEQEQVAARTANVIKTTGGAAKVTAGHVADLAGSLQEATGSADDQIQSGANLVLTFKNIRNEAGASNKIFDRTVAAANDMSVALGTDMKAASMQLGKALNDPVQGMSQLRRVGVNFTEQQQEQIKAMVESGDAMGAQKIMLAEIESQFGGAASAQGPLTEAWQSLQRTFEDVAEGALQVALPAITALVDTVKTNVVPALGAAADSITPIVQSAFANLVPAVERIVTRVGQATASVVSLVKANWPQIQQVSSQVFGALSSVVTMAVGAVSAALPRITAAVQAVLQAVGPIVADIARLIAELAPKLKPAVDEIGRTIGSIADLVRAVANRVQQLWDKFGDEIIAVVRFAFGRIVPVIKPLLATVRAVIETITALISGDWEGVWDGLKDIASNALRAVWAVVRGAFDTAVTIAKELGERIVKGIGNGLRGVASAVREGVVSGVRRLGDLGASLLSKGAELGKKIVTGIVNAIKDGASQIAGAVWDAIPGSGAVQDAVGSVLGIFRRAAGGFIPGAYAGVDTIPAMLAPGEAVLNPRQQAMVPGGRNTLMEIFRRTGAPTYAGGGFVNPVPGGSWSGGPGGGTHSRSENGYVWQDDDAYDIMGSDGMPVVAGFDGIIGRISPFNSDSRYWGHGLYLSGSAGTLFYKHLKSVAVSSGARVSAGTKLGVLGAGVNGGPHLHLGAQPVSLLAALRAGGVVSPGDATSGGDGAAPNERQAPPKLSDRQKLARQLGQAVGRPGLGAGRKVSTWAGPLVSALSNDVPDVSGALAGTSYTGPQSRSISRAARTARTEARRAGKSPEDVRAAGEEAERQAELKVLRQNRRAVIQAQAKLRKKKKKLHNDWKKLTRKPAKTAKGRAARKKSVRLIQAKLREYTAEINDCTEMIAEINERMAELNEQAIEAQHEANYAAGDAADGAAGGDAGGTGDMGPTAGDFTSAAIAQAALTEGLEDDLAAAQSEELRLHHEYNAATYTGDPRLIGPAAQALLAARQAVQGIRDQIAAQQPTELDRLNLRGVEAQFTDRLDDDLQVAKDLEAYYQREVDKARGTGDPRAIAAALQALLSARQSREAIEQNTGALRDNTDAMRGMTGSLVLAYRGQDYVLGSLTPPSSDRVETIGVGV